MKQTKLTALMMVVLVISIPFCFSSVTASSFLHVKSASGRDNIYNDIGGQLDGYRRYYDNVTINLDCQIDNDSNIGTNQVRVNTYWSTSCTGSAGVFNCKYTESGYKDGTASYIIQLYNDSGTVLRSQTVYITTDKLEPVVKSFSITPQLTNGVNVSFYYTVEDYANAVGDTSRCSGIKKIEFYKDDFSGQPIQTIEPIDKTQCSITGSFKYSSTDQSGTVRICAKAYDRLDYSSTAAVCKTFVVDKQAPQVVSARVLRQDNNIALKYVADAEVPAIVVLNISANDLPASSLKADLSELNSQAHNLTPNSVDVVAGYTVARFNIGVRLSQSKAPSIKVYGMDNAGNKITPAAVAAQQIVYDLTGPVINAIRTSRGQLNGQWLVGRNVTFIADVAENAGNLQNNKIYLDLSGLGLGVLQADNCTGTYTCYWFNKQINKPTGTEATVSATTESQDDLANHAAAAKSITVKVDNSPVQVIKIQINAAHGAIVIPGANYTVRGDKLSVVANVSDLSQVTAYANFSKVISTDGYVPAACSFVSGTQWQCLWDTSPIDKSGPFSAPVYFTFVDFVGNRYTVSRIVTVQGIKNETNPNYWSSDVKCSPSMIDRQVTSLIEQRIYCDVHLTSSASNAQTLSISLGSCQSVYNNSLDYVSSVGLLNDIAGSTDPYLKIALKTTAMKISRLEFNCPLSIMSRIGTSQGAYIVQNPEVENVTIQVLFYNLPLGEFTSEAQQKIEDIKNNAIVKMKLIGTLQKLLTFARTLCNVIKVFQDLVDALNKISTGLSLTSWLGMGTTTAASTAAKKTTDTTENTQEGLIKTLGKFCDYVRCKKTLWGGWYAGEKDKVTGEKNSVWNLFGNSALAKKQFSYTEKLGFGQMWPENPSDSIVLSLATGCIPGIIDGLQKWRQIQCNYGVCLRDSTKQSIPLKACEDQKSYLECKFIFGEIFQIIPFAGFFKGLLQKFYSIISDPIGLIFGLTSVICSPLVWTEGPAHPICILQKQITKYLNLIGDIIGVIDSVKNMFKPANDMCNELLKDTTATAAKAKTAATTS